MKNCFFVPRLLVPSRERKKWSVIACDRYRNERSYWTAEAESHTDGMSALDLVIPEALLGEEGEIDRMREAMYRALEEDWLEKLARGWVLIERKFLSGVRRGIVAAIDLECYSYGGGDNQVRSLQEAPEELVRLYLSQRESSPLEMPHIMAVYSDPRDKAVNALLKEDLEKLYEYKIKGGFLKGSFIPEYAAEETAETLLSRAQNFYIVEGIAAAEAAKLHWQKVKAGLTKGEMGRHPARFLLAEFLNLNDDAVEIGPVHRLLKETEADAFCDYFSKKFKCEKKERVLCPKIPFTRESVREVDDAIAQFLKADGGTLAYIHGDARLKKFAADEDAAGVLMPSPKKETLFKDIKDGGAYPAYSLCIGGAEGARYYVEAREISYD